MTLGPLEYTVIGFEGNRFNGEIAKEIGAVVDAGIIALVDVVMVTQGHRRQRGRHRDRRQGRPALRLVRRPAGRPMGLLTPEDIETIAEGLPNNTSALVLLFEHRWAVAIKEAIGAAGGFLVSRTTVPPEILELVNAELEAEAATA